MNYSEKITQNSRPEFLKIQKRRHLPSFLLQKDTEYDKMKTVK